MDILEQAIADAKSIREAAVANAKASLVESFRPTLQRMISSRLEEEGDEDEIEMGADMGVDQSAIAPEVAPVAPVAPPEGVAPEEVPAPEAAPEDDLDLEELLAELDAIEGDSAVPSYGEPEEEPVMEGDGAYDEKLGDKSKNLKEVDMTGAEAEGDEEDINLDELFKEAFGKKIATAATKVASAPTTAVIAENRELKKKLKEALQAVSIMKTAVNETMLLNARLFYANKINKNFQLSEGQKGRMLEAFDRSNSPHECKLVYSALAQQLQEAKLVASTPSTTKKAIVESMTRKGITPKTNEFNLRDRWGVLSGLKPLE